METSLHRELKQRYAGNGATEVRVDGFRIDAVAAGSLIEIQHASLASLRTKLERLLGGHQVLVVKPIVVRKRIVKRARRGGTVRSWRFSPKRGRAIDLFEELVYFTRIFPHRNLTLETPLVEIEEWRVPGHGRRRRRRADDFQIEDQKLIAVREVRRYRNAGDLLSLLPGGLERPFHTGHLAEQLDVPRWAAQRIAYCLRQTGAVCQVGKAGNALLYE